MPIAKILVVEDEAPVRNSTIRVLEGNGFQVEAANTGEEGLAKMQREPFDLLLIDIRMPGMSGLEMLQRAKQMDPETCALIITGYSTIQSAIEALELGAQGFIQKPATGHKLIKAVKEALARGQLGRENARLRAFLPLFEVTRALHGEVELSRLFPLILRTVVNETKADIASLLLIEGENQQLSVGATLGLPEESNSWQKVSEAVAGVVVQTLEPYVLLWETCDDPKIKEELGKTKVASLVCLPLLAKGKAIGLIELGKLADKAPFSPSDMELLAVLCGEMAVAIENATLFDRVKAQQFQVQELLAQVVVAQEQERRRLSLELHDSPTQLVTGSLYEVETCSALLDKSNFDGAQAKLVDVRHLLEQSIDELRRLAADLHPPALEKSGLVPALRQYVTEYKRNTGIACTLQAEGKAVRLPSQLEISIYRIAQEALTNVRKHAKASAISIQVKFCPDNFIINITDNGEGFELLDMPRSEKVGARLGLEGMKERAKMIGGTLTINTSPGGGTTIGLTVPIQMPLAKESLEEAGKKHG